MRNVRFIYWFTVCLLLVAGQVCFGQTDQGQTGLLAVHQQLSEIGNQIPAQIRKVDDPTVRVFLQLRIATLLWSERGENFTAQAQSLTTGALEELDAQRELVPKLYSDLFRRDLVALLEANAPELAKRYKPDSASGIDVAYSTLNLKGREGLAIELLNKELANGLVPDSTILFFLHRLEKQQPAELPRALSDLLSAEERRVGAIPVEVLLWLVDFYLNPNSEPALKRRFLAAAVLATAGSYSLSDSSQISDAYNLLQAILPQVKSLVPSLYPQAVGQLSSLMGRIPSKLSEREEIAERIRVSGDPLSQTISEARSANERNLKDELFLEAAQLALEKGKLRLSLELAMSVSLDSSRKKWREQFLGQLANTAIDKKDADIAGAVIPRIESPLTRVEAMQKLSLYFFDLKEIWKARELLTDSLKVINSLEDKTEKTLALLRVLPLFLKVSDTMVPDLAEQAIKSINSIPTPDNKADKTNTSEYVRKTLMPLAWQALPAFKVLAEWDENTTMGLVERIQLGDIRTSALLGVAMGRLAIAKKTVVTGKRRKSRAHHSIQLY